MSKVSSSEFVSYAAEMLSQLADLAHDHGMIALRNALVDAHAIARDSAVDATLCDLSREAEEAGRPIAIANGFGN
jgi:hypothetical protein